MLRAAEASDASAVAAVLLESRRAFLPFAPSAHPPEEVQDWVRTMLLPAGRVVVCEIDSQIVGVLVTSENENVAWIEQLYLLPGFTGQGLGSKLLAHAHAILPRPIHLYTFQQNVGARRFYERHGYKAIRFSDGQQNEEQRPDVLYELAGQPAEA